MSGESLFLKDLKNKVVLIDFWTYSCVNCIRTLPHLKKWHEKYHSLGLVIVGVHTPEFEFEAQPENVKQALEKFEIKYPVVLDSEYKIWNLYANHFWPRKLVLNKEGRIIYDHAGEGEYIETEKVIQEALKEIGAANLPALETDEGYGSGGICYPTTPETYLGYDRGFLGNGDYGREKITDYQDPGNHKVNRFYLSGKWLSKPGYVESAGEASTLVLNFAAVQVNLVMDSKDRNQKKVLVRLGGEYLNEKNKGKDIEIRNDGESYVLIQEAKMYELLDSPGYAQGELELIPQEPGVEIFAFTFGGCPVK